MISIIAAVAENGVIGKDNKLPWHLSGDLNHFSAITRGHIVLMGSNTYRSILNSLGKPLPNRKNIVISSKNHEEFAGAETISSINEISELSKKEDIFVIGGASIYKQLLPFSDKLYITRVHTKPDGDAFFPELNESEWEFIKAEQFPKDDKNDYDYTFLEYEKRK